VPPQPAPRPGARSFGEHLDALARLLADSRRYRSSVRALLDGTRRRLGPLVRSPRAAAVLEAPSGEQTSAADVQRVAAQARELELELNLAPPHLAKVRP
jgi:hypothetical protein